MEVLRKIFHAKSPRVIEAFHRPFLDQIRAKGRLFGWGLVLQYKRRSGPCFRMLPQGPRC